MPATSSTRGHHIHDITLSDSTRAHLGDVHGDVHNHFSSRAEDPGISCRKALFLTDPAIDRRSLIDKKGKRVEGTCAWIEQHEEYKAWLAGGPGLLWVCGGPGKGKTMLSLYLTQQLELKPDANVIYFFCSCDDDQRSTSTAVVRSLLWQITTKRPELTRHVSPYFDSPERAKTVLSTPGTLWDILTNLTQDASLEKTFCLIDGLDECKDESMEWLVSQIIDLTKHSGSDTMRILVSSRDLPSLRGARTIRLDPDNDDAVSADIDTFTSIKVNELAQRLVLSEDFSSRIKADLLKKAGGTFLWIGYAMLELLTKNTATDVQEAVADLPIALPALYRRMIRRIPSNRLDTSTQILRWVILAARKLRLRELAAAVTWPLPKDMDPDHAFKDYVKACEPFVSVQGEQVTLVHQSARDFLLSSEEDEDAIVESFRVKAAEGHLSIAETCLKVFNETDSPLANYATSHWPEHVRLCGEKGGNSILRTTEFFGKRSEKERLWWSEYVSIERAREGEALEPRLPHLHQAAYLDLKQWVHILLSGSKLRIRLRRSLKSRSDDLRRAPLHYAVLGGSLEMVSLLLAKGADPTVIDKDGMSPLWYAVVRGQADKISLLIAHGASPHGPQGNHYTSFPPLMQSIIQGNAGLVRRLLENGADPNVTVKGMTVLHKASEMGQLRIVELLLHHGADPNAICDSIFGVTVLLEAVETGQPRIVELLLHHGADPNDTRNSIDDPTVLQRATELGQLRMVELLLDHGACIHGTTVAAPQSPLQTAVQYKQIAVVELLLDRGASSPTLFLMLAIRLGDQEAMKIALRRGADPNERIHLPDFGDVPGLHRAVHDWQYVHEFSGYTLSTCGSIIKSLLEHGADPNLRDTHGKTALDHADHGSLVFNAVSRILDQHQKTAQRPLGHVPCNLDLLRTGGIQPFTPRRT